MKDHPDNYERVCCLCQEYRDPIELSPCTRRTFENGAWVKREESMCNYCQENLNEIQDEDESENEDVLYETCKGCNGSGVEHHPDYPPCSACSGNGVVEVEDDESENVLYETYLKRLETDYAMSKARKLK